MSVLCLTKKITSYCTNLTMTQSVEALLVVVLAPLLPLVSSVLPLGQLFVDYTDFADAIIPKDFSSPSASWFGFWKLLAGLCCTNDQTFVTTEISPFRNICILWKRRSLGYIFDFSRYTMSRKYVLDSFLIDVTVQVIQLPHTYIGFKIKWHERYIENPFHQAPIKFEDPVV